MNMMIDLVQSGPMLKVVSTVTAGLFAGGALYITAVEQPARMTHDPTSAITMWKPSFVRAQSIQVLVLFVIYSLVSYIIIMSYFSFRMMF